MKIKKLFPTTLISLSLVLLIIICNVKPAYASDDRITVAKKDAELPTTLTLCFAGDMNLDENWCTTQTLDKQANGIYDCIAPDLIQSMQQADIFMPNNEFTYSERGTKLPNKAWTFRANPSRVNIMK